MELDTNRVRELLDARDKIDQELQDIFNVNRPGFSGDFRV